MKSTEWIIDRFLLNNWSDSENPSTTGVSKDPSERLEHETWNYKNCYWRQKENSTRDNIVFVQRIERKVWLPIYVNFVRFPFTSIPKNTIKK